MATSPYLEREAEKLRLAHPAPPSPFGTGAARIGSSADHDPRGVRYPRSQREAGIEHPEWDARIKPMRPVWFFVISAGCWAILGLAVAWTCAAFGG